MEGKQIRFGSVAVLLAVALLCVAVLAALTVVTASADLRTAQRYGQTLTQQTACQDAGARWRAAIDAYLAGAGPLPEGTAETGETLSTTLTRGGMTLEICLQRRDGGYEILRWACRGTWQPEGETFSLWQQGSELK